MVSLYWDGPGLLGFISTGTVQVMMCATDRMQHYNDVIMSAIASQITGVSIVYLTRRLAQIKENIKARRHWPLWGEFTGDRWIPLTKGQQPGKCSQLMTSSWNGFKAVFHVRQGIVFDSSLLRSIAHRRTHMVKIYINQWTLVGYILSRMPVSRLLAVLPIIIIVIYEAVNSTEPFSRSITTYQCSCICPWWWWILYVLMVGEYWSRNRYIFVSIAAVEFILGTNDRIQTIRNVVFAS